VFSFLPPRLLFVLGRQRSGVLLTPHQIFTCNKQLRKVTFVTTQQEPTHLVLLYLAGTTGF